ncbi:hypothetical protein HEP85_38550 [Streptomyces sp. RPA4-2]|uniref:hypothetical protein n=1 Tax=Streptomyces sp. RPA4-2 TaxID=2721244 RepID=UPI00143EA8C3|nr:hypothetical protein [Streptomyces sp. RPA4-2]QIY66362.1 hypothetical protein HEP85_38550 [Streptomyces sp. RPA4-2]
MAYRLVIASTAGCTAGGILVAEGVFRHTWELAAGGTGFLSAGAVGFLAATMRSLLVVSEARTRRDLSEVAEERRRLESDMRARERAVEQLEYAVDRRVAVTALRIASYAKALDDTRDENASLRLRIVELKHEIDEVNDERNQLITQELVAGNDRFTSKCLFSVPGCE